MAALSEIDTLEQQRTGAKARFGGRMIGAAVILVAAAAIAVVLIFSFANAERDRAVRAWQSKLVLIAESRLQAVDAWLLAQQEHIRALAENTALKLYVTELALADGDPAQVTDARAQRGYLQNLLAAVAERGRFTGPVLGAAVNANVERTGTGGIGLVDRRGRLLVATPSMPPLDQRVADALRVAARGGPALIDLHANVSGAPVMGFVHPVVPVQHAGGSVEPIAYVVGVKQVSAELYPLLHQPGLSEQSAEAMLVRRNEAAVEYLSPMADGTGPLERQLAVDTKELAAAFALNEPGGFAAKRDYRDTEVLATARAVTGAPWALLFKIDRAEALGEAEARRTRLIAILLLLVALVAAALVSVWFHASSRTADRAMKGYRDIARRFEGQKRLLRLVTDAQPSEVAIVDDAGRYLFANRRVAAEAGIESADVIGKTVAALRGPEEAKRLSALNQKALAGSTPVRVEHWREVDGSRRVLQSEHVPLSETHDMPESVLVVSKDVTEVVVAREKHARTMRDLVGTLVAMVDRRDPHASHHSRRVAEVAHAIAGEMGLEPRLRETAESAALLMNVGKIAVPRDLLTADRTLSDDEMVRVRDAILLGAELLDEVAFDGPVVETLRQMFERVDGGGAPNGLKGDAILPTAQICAVANAFVGIVSTRAYRVGMDFDSAIDILMAECGKRFDRGVVAALVSHLDHHGGRSAWAHFREPGDDSDG